MLKNTPTFEINTTEYPSSCLPASLNKTNLVDITNVGHAWRVYIDTSTGKIHNGAEYYEQYLESLDKH